MNYSYFKEPTGIFKTVGGFSMGDCAAARGSEIILRISELNIFRKIASRGLKKNVRKYLRFRDDISVLLVGEISEILSLFDIITNGYPREITLNVEANIITGNFLNIRSYNQIDIDSPFTTILRKPSTKYDIIPFNSNTHFDFKKCAGLHYFRTIRTHCSTVQEKQHQRLVVYEILKHRGFPYRIIRRLEKHRSRKNIQKKQLRTVGKYEIDLCSNRVPLLKKILKLSGVADFQLRLPVKTSGKKLQQHIFTLKKMKSKLKF